LAIFSTAKITHYFWQKCIGQHFWLFFHQLIWSPCSKGVEQQSRVFSREEDIKARCAKWKCDRKVLKRMWVVWPDWQKICDLGKSDQNI
jgi:hypothetical protein